MPQGKITKALSGFYYVLTENQEVIQCRGRGLFRKRDISPLVGDFVTFQADNEREGYILSIEERKNELVRPPIANVDQAIIVCSAKEPDFSSLLLDKFLIAIESKSIDPLIIISKIELGDIQEIKKYVDDYRQIGYNVIEVSSLHGQGLDACLPFLKGKTSVIAGQSGVGKSSLLNALDSSLNLLTNEISTHLGRGKHTTRHVELLEVGEGLVADTPGFSQLDLTEISKIASCFPEFRVRSEECKFRECLHLKEPKCAVKEAVNRGKIPLYRYEHYEKFMMEMRERKPRY